MYPVLACDKLYEMLEILLDNCQKNAAWAAGFVAAGAAGDGAEALSHGWKMGAVASKLKFLLDFFCGIFGGVLCRSEGRRAGAGSHLSPTPPLWRLL